MQVEFSLKINNLFERIALNLYIGLLILTVIVHFYSRIMKVRKYLDSVDFIYVTSCVFFEFTGRVFSGLEYELNISLYDLFLPCMMLFVFERRNGTKKSSKFLMVVLAMSMYFGVYAFEMISYALCIIVIVLYNLKLYLKNQNLITFVSSFVMAVVFLLSMFNLLIEQRAFIWKDSQYLSYYLVVFSSALVLNLLLINAKSSRYFTV